jgi:hypothetical protein
LYLLSLALTIDPEDADLDNIDNLPKTVSVTDTLEITDSNGPPDLTNSEDFDYGSNQEVYEYKLTEISI